jgi:hypothetical protein
MIGAVEVGEALRYANELLDKVPVGEAYNLVSEAGTMLVNKWLGVRQPDALWEAGLVMDVINNNSIDEMLNGFRRFAERVLRGATNAMFLTDVLGWKYGIGGSMMITEKKDDDLESFAKLVNQLKESATNEDITTKSPVKLGGN